MTVADPYLGFRYRPNLTGHLKRGDLDFTFTTDEKGFRNSSPVPDAADIVVIGDSMAFGYGVPDDATWTHRVAARLAQLHDKQLRIRLAVRRSSIYEF